MSTFLINETDEFITTESDLFIEIEPSQVFGNGSFFDPLTPKEQAQYLALHFPQGQLWTNVFNPNSNIGKLVQGLAVELYRFEVLLGNISVEIDANQTSDLILEWEASVGIPDICFGRAQSIEERRNQVVQKLTSFGGVQTAEDFERVAAIFGYDINVIESGSVSGSFPASFPVSFYGGKNSAAHIIVISVNDTEREVFPLPFPTSFGGTSLTILQCLFRRLAPANCDIVYITRS